MSNWLQKTGKNKPAERKCITYDFDRTMTLPSHNGEYMYYGLDPNHKMIEQLKEHARKGYIVGIVTSRNQDYENPGHDYDLLRNPAVAVEDFIRQHNLPVSFVRFTNWTPKGPHLRDVGSILHHDDDLREIESCEEYGIPYVHIQHYDE